MTIRGVAGVTGAGLGMFVLVMSGSAAARAAQPAAGLELFLKRCGGCHALDRDKEGPRLGGVYGSKAGSVESFQYSEALRKSGIRWDSETLERWLSDTEKVVPDNDMSARVQSPDERREIISYLKQNGGR